MAKKFDYQAAKKSGYSDEEISQFLLEKHPKFDYKSAIESGYSSDEINQYLSSYKKERSGLEKAGRVATQFGIGVAENALLPYEAAVAPLANKSAQTVALRAIDFEEIERLGAKKRNGGDLTGPWDEQDEKILNNLLDQVNNPEKMDPFVQTADIGVRGLAEKISGKDLHPEGVVEKAANWLGFLKNPTKGAAFVKDVAKTGIKPSELLKAIAPGEKTFRSLGAATGLQAAEDGEFGPLGTIGAAIAGDVIAGKAANVAGTLASGKKGLAKAAAKFTPKQSLELQKELIKDFREAGVQADIGTITNSDLLKMAQARLSQSGLTGDGLEQLRKQITTQIKDEYKAIAESLGEARFQTLHEAGEIGKEAIVAARDIEKAGISNLYEKARAAVKPGATVDATNLSKKISQLTKSLEPGSLKSAEQKSVIDSLKKVSEDIKEGKVSVLDLMNSKIALGDIINYEVQGGQKQLLKSVVQEIDQAIKSYGTQNPLFYKLESKANESFKSHAKKFRNPNIDKIITSQDPATLMNKMNTVQGIKDIEKALSFSEEGKKMFGDLKRLKLDQMIGNKMTDNVVEQLKTGKFSNLLQNPKDKQIALELLGKEGFSRLARLQKISGKLSQTANKFLNASKSGTTVLDAALVATALKDVGMLLAGNPWPALKSAGIYGTIKYATKLIADPNFLKLVEDAVLASSKNDIPKMLSIGKQMEQPIKAALMQSKSNTSD
jgi:hypothetical protein